MSVTTFRNILPTLRLLSAAVITALLTTACEDSTSQAGGSLVQDRVEIIMDSTYTVTGKSVPFTEIQSCTSMQLLGRLNADGYGSISSDVVTQYMPAAALDTSYVKPEYVDSVKMVLAIYADGFTGDSIAPMGLSVYRLNKQLPSPIFSSFNPADYYDPAPIGSTTYSTAIDGFKAISADDYGSIYKNVTVDLPVEFGRDLYAKYLADPSAFNTPQSFAEYFPGLYIANSFGSGRVTRIDKNVIQLYYHKVIPAEVYGTLTDSIEHTVGNYLGVTPEIISNNNIRQTLSSSLTSRIAAGEQLIVAPLGYDVEFTFPTREIIANYKAQSGDLAVINSLSFSIPVEYIENDFSITPPPYVLMVQKSKKKQFFENSEINDNVTSFYASYNSATRSYDFSSMRDYIKAMLDKDEITDEDTEFVITPVLVAFYENESSSSYYYYYYYSSSSVTRYVAKISPYVTEPVMGRLRLDKAKIKFTFSKQSINF